MLYPLKFNAIYKEKIWGGEKIASVLHRPTGGMNRCGESWELSGFDEDVRRPPLPVPWTSGQDLRGCISRPCIRRASA